MNKRSNRVVAMGLLAVMMLAGCGGSSGGSTTAPQDTVPPAAVVGLEALGIDSVAPVAMLSWEAGAEADLAGYVVYRIISGGTAEQVCVTKALSWVDHNVTADVEIVYQVSAVDQADNESARSSSNTVVVRVDQGTGKDQVGD